MVRPLKQLLLSKKKNLKPRRLRALANVNRKADLFIKNTCNWYKVDDDNKISISSTDMLDNDSGLPPPNFMDQHACHYLTVKNELELILNQTAFLLASIPKDRHELPFIEPLQNLEKDMTSAIHRKLYKKRRTDMQTTCVLERKKNKNKVHNFTTRSLDEGLMELLNKGPSTIPKQTIPICTRKQVCKSYLTNIVQQTVGCFSDKPKLTPMGLGLNRPNLPHNDIINAEDNITFVNKLVDNLPEPRIVTEHPEILRKLRDLSNDPSITINTADKNLGLSINDTSWYATELYRHTDDETTYIEIHDTNEDELIQTSVENLNTLIMDLLENEVDVSILKPLTDSKTKPFKLPSLNLLPKVHKLTSTPCPENQNILKGRPIVNGYNFTTSQVSRLFGEKMSKITEQLRDQFATQDIPFPCLKNSDELIETLHELPDMNLQDIMQTWIITFDFESLYTNITSEHVCNMLHLAHEQGFINEQDYNTCELLYDFIQTNNFFHIGYKKFFRQINGLSMGSYDAQDTSNNVLLFKEFLLLQDPDIKKHVTIYKRYIDDGYLTMKGNTNDVYKICRKVSTYLPNDIPIEFSIRKFNNNFLDLNVKIDHDTFKNGRFSHSVYQKKLNTYSYIHRTSNHPQSIFKGIVKTESIRYTRKSSSYIERSHIHKLFNIRLRKQGYKTTECREYINNNQTKQAIDTKHMKIVKIRFTEAHGLNLAAKQIIRKSKYFKSRKIMGVNVNNKKLKQILLTKKKLHNKIGVYM